MLNYIHLKDWNGQNVTIKKNDLLSALMDNTFILFGMTMQNIIDLKREYQNRGGVETMTSESIQEVFRPDKVKVPSYSRSIIAASMGYKTVGEPAWAYWGVNDESLKEEVISQYLTESIAHAMPDTCNTNWQGMIDRRGDRVISRLPSGDREIVCDCEKGFYVDCKNFKAMTDTIIRYLITRNGAKIKWRHFAVRVFVSNLANSTLDEPPDRTVRIVYGLEVDNG